jgi:hypothetical protein
LLQDSGGKAAGEFTVLREILRLVGLSWRLPPPPRNRESMIEETMPKKTSKGQSKIHKVMKEKKEGTLKSGSGKTVTSRKQAVAIALSEARKSGAKIPAKKKKAS